MNDVRRIVRQTSTVARLIGHALRRRLAAPGRASAPDPGTFRAQLEPWLAGLPPGLVAAQRFVQLPARRPPWYDTGIDLAPGDRVTWFADGRVFLSRLLDLWVGPSFQLWARIGERGPVFRGTRSTHTFTATEAGRLYLASYFPGEWLDPSGRLATDAGDYAKVSGGLSVLLLRWQPGVDVGERMRGFVHDARVPGLVLAEAARLDEPVPTPEPWEYLWYLGPGEIYRGTRTDDGRAAIDCRTQGDAGILRREAHLRLEPGTRLRWSWRVDELPATLPEDTLPSHDYLSIAVEFDDGQDITYYWSAALPTGTVYRCPLPTWKDKETHVVVRSGRADLGRWIEERRDVYADYQRIIGGPAAAVTRVWLIANSLFQRRRGRCEYAGIELDGPAGRITLL